MKHYATMPSHGDFLLMDRPVVVSHSHLVSRALFDLLYLPEPRCLVALSHGLLLQSTGTAMPTWMVLHACASHCRLPMLRLAPSGSCRCGSSSSTGRQLANSQVAACLATSAKSVCRQGPCITERPAVSIGTLRVKGLRGVVGFYVPP